MKATFVPAWVILFLAIAAGSPSRLSLQDLSKVDFAAECTTESNPSDRLMYEHEDMVNSFLNVGMKFGKSRLIVIHESNERMARHGGTTQTPGGWSEKGQSYVQTAEWGLMGDVGQKEPKVYYFRPSKYLGGGVPGFLGGINGQQPSKPSERPVDRFEAYALSQLRKDEALVRWERDDFMRAVGAVRAETACLKCHEVKQGELLGAFTYEFSKARSVEPKEPDKLVQKLHGEGKSLEDIARMLPGNEKMDENGMRKWYAIDGVRRQLLAAGIVSSEMVDDQRRHRRQMLEGFSLGPYGAQ